MSDGSANLPSTKELHEESFSTLEQEYSDYQQVCYALIINQQDYSTCKEILTYLLSEQRAIFSNEYRNFFYCMYHCAPVVLFYLMQFSDARELYLGSGNTMVEDYKLLDNLVASAQQYESALEYVKNRNGNSSVDNYRKAIEHTKKQALEDHSYALDAFALLDDDGAISSLPDPQQDVIFRNISKTTRTIDGRSKLGREFKSLINNKIGHFKWMDLPKRKLVHYKDNEAFELLKQEHLKSKSPNVLIKDLYVKSNQAHNNEHDLERFFISPKANNNIFELMHLIADNSTFGPLNGKRKNDLEGLHLSKDPQQLFTHEAKDMVEKLAAFISTERQKMGRRLLRLATDNWKLYEIFGLKLHLLTINPKAFHEEGVTLEDMEQDCLILKLGSALQVRPTTPISLDKFNDSPWLESVISDQLLITSGLELQIAKREINERLDSEQQRLALDKPYNQWKQAFKFSKLEQGTYNIMLSNYQDLPERFTDTNFGPYDLLYITL